MKIAVLGTGVIGTLYGWALSEKNEIVHIVRSEKMQRCDRTKIRMDIIDERLPENHQNRVSEYIIHAMDHPDNDTDLIIVPVAEHQLEQALIDLEKYAGNARYLLMASNWKGTELIDKHLQREQYVLGYAGGGGTFQSHGGEQELWGNIGADVIIGAIDKSQNVLLAENDQLFREINIIPEVQKNILHWLWIHNIDSAAMGAGLKKYGNIQDFLADTDLVQTCFEAMMEGFAICEKRGVNLEQFPEVQMYAMPFEQLYPMFRNNFETNPIMQRYTAHAVDAIPEMMMNFKQIYESGKSLHIDMPNMEKLHCL